MNIPHDALKNNIRNLVCEAFKIRGAKYLIVNRHGKAHWKSECNKNAIVLLHMRRQVCIIMCVV